MRITRHRKNGRRLNYADLADWVNAREAIQFLGLGRATVYAQIKTGVIPSRKFGRRILIPKTALKPEFAA